MWSFALLPGHKGNPDQGTEIEPEIQERLFLTLSSLNLQFQFLFFVVLFCFLFFLSGVLLSGP